MATTSKKTTARSKAASTAKKPEMKVEQTKEEPTELKQETTQTETQEATNEISPYETQEVEQTQEQKEYVAEYNRYIDLHGGFPDTKLSAADLREANDKKLEQQSRSANVPEVSTLGSVVSKELRNDRNYIVIRNKKTGESRRLKRLTWNLLKKSPGDFEEVADIPEEVKQLNQKKGVK